MTNPTGHDVYFTQVKTKYLKGLVTSAGSVIDSSGSTVSSSYVLEIVNNDGTTLYIPLYTSVA